MNRLFTVFILSLCVYSAFGAATNRNEDKKEEGFAVVEPKDESGLMAKFLKFLTARKESAGNETVTVRNETRSRRQAYGQPQPQRLAGPSYGQPQPTPYGAPQYALPQQGPPPRLGNQIVDGGLGQEFPDFYDFYPNDFLYDYYDWVCSDTSCQLCNILTSECCDPDVNVNCFLPDSCLNNPCLSGGTCIPTRTIDERPDFICACYPGFTGKYCQLTNEFFFPPPPPPPMSLPQRPQYVPPYQPPQYQPQPSYQQQPQYQQQAPSYNNNNNGPVRGPAPVGPAPVPLQPLGPVPQPRLPVGNGVAPVPQPRLPQQGLPQQRI